MKSAVSLASMKVIALILTLNILVASNGIAISEHFCSKMEQSIKDTNSDLEQNENCCHTNYIGFEKQDLEGNVASSIILKKVHQQIVQLYYADILNLKTQSTESIKLEYPPPLLHILSKIEPANLQVFRC